MIECVESDESRVWAAQTRKGLRDYLGCLATILNLDQNGALPYSLLSTAGILLLTEQGAKAQTEHKNFDDKDEKSPRYFSVVTGELSPLFYVLSELHLYIH